VIWAVVVLEGLVIVLLAVLVVGLLRSHAEILKRLHDLGAGVYDEATAAGATPHVPGGDQGQLGAPAPGLSGVTPDGRTAAVAPGGGQQILVAFLSSNCLTCRGFWDEFGRARRLAIPGPPTRLVIVTKSPEDELPDDVARLAPRHHVTLMSSSAWADYGVPVSPYFVLVGADGTVIGEGAAGTWAQVSDLLQKAAADAEWADGAATGGQGGRTRSGAGGPGTDDANDAAGATDSTDGGRERRADAELRAAGIEPGDPRLYHAPSSPGSEP
jgi:hypothetical protein